MIKRSIRCKDKMYLFVCLKVLLILPLISANNRCQLNDCICLSDYISCYNKNIRDVLSFSYAEREKVTYLDLRSVELNSAPSLDKSSWPKLKVPIISFSYRLPQMFFTLLSYKREGFSILSISYFPWKIILIPLPWLFLISCPWSQIFFL